MKAGTRRRSTSRRPTARTNRARLQVTDRRALAQLLNEVIAERFDGSTAAAAKATNEGLPAPQRLHRAQLVRLCQEKRASLRRNTVAWLWRLVRSHPDGPARLLNAILPPEQRERRAKYAQWLSHAAREATHALVQRPSATRGYYVAEIALDARASHPAAFVELDQLVNRESLRLQRNSAEWARLRLRAWLAEYRAFAPFLGAVESGGIERQWHELSKEEQGQFAYHALKCEVILLRRPGEEVRAQVDPNGFLVAGELTALAELRRWKQEMGWEADADRN